MKIKHLRLQRDKELMIRMERTVVGIPSPSQQLEQGDKLESEEGSETGAEGAPKERVECHYYYHHLSSSLNLLLMYHVYR